MNNSKIQLSTEEMELVTNSDWILTKHRIIKKVYELFGNLSADMQSFFAGTHALSQEILSTPAKISKGEQYLALPYVVLDYPRYFSKADVFAIRTFFWWGNYFSISFHLKGKFKLQFEEKIYLALSQKKFGDFYISTSGDEFSFNLHEKNYAFVSGEYAFNLKQKKENSFLKISYKVPLEQWDFVQEEIMKKFLQIMNAVID